MSPPMRRRLCHVAILLLLGAIVNIAVAWGCAVFVRDFSDRSQVWSSRGTDIDHRLPEYSCVRNTQSSTGELTIVAYCGVIPLVNRPTFDGAVDELIPAYSDRFLLGSGLRDTANVSLGKRLFARLRATESHGWPLPTLWGGVEMDVESPVDPAEVFRLRTHSAFLWNRQVRTPQDLWKSGLLPLMPIGHYFAFNTLFYAVIFWVFCAITPACRRQWRAKRGLCHCCGYDLRGSPADSSKCPECGATIGQSCARKKTAK